MPKERIYGRRREPNDLSPDIVVQWDKAADHHTYESDGYQGYVSLVMESATGDELFSMTNLDRTSINRLVSTLRRARNAAFGGDE